MAVLTKGVISKGMNATFQTLTSEKEGTMGSIRLQPHQLNIEHLRGKIIIKTLQESERIRMESFYKAIGLRERKVK